ncbi:proline-serine-threonine phosphatase-interacting protein 2-like isoform X2 [Lathamus discolor]|uniref:proline-serine-threonine phosphatase-interacting protein 2-like isoform X2 n=2 Tax=Lathamus discolor TaxID=678569 RepID=UPI0032B7E897
MPNDWTRGNDLKLPQIELITEAIQKTRNLLCKKTMGDKCLNEHRCREKDEAEQAVPHNTNMVTKKQQEKLFLNLAKTKSSPEDSAGVTSRVLPYWRRSGKNNRKSTSRLMRELT